MLAIIIPPTMRKITTDTKDLRKKYELTLGQEQPIKIY
jgi:hypothetical protein